jgi:hypothetical protein
VSGLPVILKRTDLLGRLTVVKIPLPNFESLTTTDSDLAFSIMKIMG